MDLKEKTVGPRITVLTGAQQVLAHLDNSLPDALHYYGDTLHIYLQGAAHTLEMSVPAQHLDARYLQAGNRLAFRHNGRAFYMTIITVHADRSVLQLFAQGLTFELIREEQPALDSQAKTFAGYLAAFGADTGNIRINVNEISDKKLALKWDGSQTILARLYSLANSFDAELEFKPVITADNKLDHFEMNVYKKRADGRGIGEDRSGITLRPGIDYQTISREVDLSELYTAIRPTGKDGLNLSGYSKPEDEFVLAADMIRSPAGQEAYPSVVHGVQGDGYILYRWQTEYSSQAQLYSQAAAELRKHCRPKVTYELEGNIEGAGIGDVYAIRDSGFYPEIHLKARVVEQLICMSNPAQSRTVLDNFSEVI